MNREEVIKEYCKLAEFYCLNPWDFKDFKQQSKIHNISKKEYIEILNKEQYKNKLWETVIYLQSKTLKK